jgi:hypothetical protein
MTNRERQLLDVNHEKFLPVDFHSWRRAAGQSLARAGVNAQTARKITAHATEAAHNLYLQNTTRAIVIPAESLPNSLPLPVGHTTLGTIGESGRIQELELPEITQITRQYPPLAAGAELWVPAVGGSNPLTPTLLSCFAAR